MLLVSGENFDISELEKEYPGDSIEAQLLNDMSADGTRYKYDDVKQLIFELSLRKEIVISAIDLNNSSLNFAGFKNSRCNPTYWKRTNNGGFLLNNGVNSGDAVNDIFTNGSEYATECATAMVIVYYKALLNVFGEELFNKIFTEIYLMGWEVPEPLLDEVGRLIKTTDFLLGDRGYFNNPDFDPETPEWRGENVIILPNSLYYGHGVGIEEADNLINILNQTRKNNSAKPAYFMDSVGRPDFKHLSLVYYSKRRILSTLVWSPFPSAVH